MRQYIGYRCIFSKASYRLQSTVIWVWLSWVTGSNLDGQKSFLKEVFFWRHTKLHSIVQKASDQPET